MKLIPVNKENKYIDPNHKDYWILTIDWHPRFDFLPRVIHGQKKDSPMYSYDRVIEWIMGLDGWHNGLDLTHEQVNATWKAYGASIHCPNNPNEFGINGNKRNWQWS